jgi:hypothetical protein
MNVNEAVLPGDDAERQTTRGAEEHAGGVSSMHSNEIHPRGDPDIVHPDNQDAVNEHCNNEDEDDDDITVIDMDHRTAMEHRSFRPVVFLWNVAHPVSAVEDHRRAMLLNEVQHMQRASFFHFVLLCAIPFFMVVIVLISNIGTQEQCTSQLSECTLEPRSFMNAFTTRCICNAVSVPKSQLVDGE